MMLELDGNADKPPTERSNFLNEHKITLLMVSLSTSQLLVFLLSLDSEDKNVFVWDYIGIQAYFWNVGLLPVASIAILYPVLIIKVGPPHLCTPL